LRVEYTLARTDVLLHRIGWSVLAPAGRAAERDETRTASAAQPLRVSSATLLARARMASAGMHRPPSP
jgi:hypothetical protein